jgi:hypothetical protein
MGGYGSGWRVWKKNVVEDSVVLSIEELVSKDFIFVGGRRRGSLTGSLAGLGFEVSLSGEGRGCVWLDYNRYGEHVHYCISLVTTVPHFGGRRWWFQCPVSGVRAGKLYLPPREIHFASRQAHQLTYTSCQNSGERDRFLRSLARQLGRDENELREIFGG